MPSRTPPSQKRQQSGSELAVRDLPQLLDSFLLAGDVNQHSERTLGNRRERINAFIAWCNSAELEYVDVHTVRGYLHYLRHRHEAKKGQPLPLNRFGKPYKPLSPGTIKSHHASLRTFFNWLVEEGEIEEAPTERVPPPLDRPDQIQPFTPEQTAAMLKVAKNPQWLRNTGREEAIFCVLLDTGIRSEELRELTVGDLDMMGGHIHVRNGKGGKGRYVPFSRTTKKALYKYTRHRRAKSHELLFVSQGGNTPGGALTREGLLKMVHRWADGAGVTGTRCSPHTFRHTFAIEFLGVGGNVFTLKEILGHTSLTMVNRYVALAQADIARQHAQFSPMTRLTKAKR